VRGKGLLIGVELVTDRATRAPLPNAEANAVVATARAEGVLIGRTATTVPGHGNVLIIAPPLVVGADEVAAIVGAVAKGIAGLRAG